MDERIVPLAIGGRLHAAMKDSGTVIEAEVRSFGVIDERAHRNHIVTQERVARELWRDMDANSRAALVSLVSEAFTQMAADPESWLETSLVAAGNQTIGVSVTFRLGNLDDEVINQRVRREAIIAEQIADLERMSGGTHPASV
jgi:hypothetical protein